MATAAVKKKINLNLSRAHDDDDDDVRRWLEVFLLHWVLLLVLKLSFPSSHRAAISRAAVDNRAEHLCEVNECHNLFKSDRQIAIKNQFSQKCFNSRARAASSSFTISRIQSRFHECRFWVPNSARQRACVKINNLWSQFHYMFFAIAIKWRRDRGSWIATRWQFFCALFATFFLLRCDVSEDQDRVLKKKFDDIASNNSVEFLQLFRPEKYKKQQTSIHLRFKLKNRECNRARASAQKWNKSVSMKIVCHFVDYINFPISRF